MELDELKEKWAEQDRKLDASLRLNWQLLRTVNLDQARSELQRLARSLALEVGLDLTAIGALGAFIAAHLSEPRFALPAIALDLWAIAIVSALIQQVATARQIDYSQPVAAIQRRLAVLRMRRSRYLRWLLLTVTLAWTPLLIVALKGLLGLDAYRLFSGAWLIANLLLGLAIIPLAIWLSHRYGDRAGRSPLIARLRDDLMGHNLKAATQLLATLAQFEDDAQDH